MEYLINPICRKLEGVELLEIVHDYDILIAGAESISDRVMNVSTKLKLISRVAVDLLCT
jgi:hypothetical protein